MASLYVDKRGLELDSASGALILYEDGQRAGSFPLVPLERLFVHSGVFISARLLGKLGELGIGVVVLSGWAGKPTLFLPARALDARRRVTQILLSQELDFCLGQARGFVAGKLAGQLRVLEGLRVRRVDAKYDLGLAIQVIDGCVSGINDAPNIAYLRGLEGAAAAGYFKGLASILPPAWGFTGRNRLPPKAGFNVLLSLGYTLLHAEAVMALHSRGFDPAVGFFHALDYGRDSLACDVMESLRGVVDDFCLQLVRDEALRVEHFSMRGEGTLLGKTGRAIFYAAYEERCAPILRANLGVVVSDLLCAFGEVKQNEPVFVRV